MPDVPLFVFNFADSENAKDDAEKIALIRDLLIKLPAANLRVLHTVVSFLAEVAAHSPENKLESSVQFSFIFPIRNLQDDAF